MLHLRKHHDEVTIDSSTGQVFDNVAALADAHDIATKYNFKWKGERDIVQRATILFNGTARFNSRDQPFIAHKPRLDTFSHQR